MRDTGIDVVGEVPWGTHFCQFYQTAQDLTDVLVPYFREGLRHNEMCVWVTAHPLTVKDAERALRREVPRLAGYIRKGQMQILDHDEWYRPSGKFDADRVLGAWVRKATSATRTGYDGMRAAANKSSFEKTNWKPVSDYEAEVSRDIGQFHSLALCSYCLDQCSPFEIIDAVSHHRFALIKRSGKWNVIESQEHRRAENALRETEERYRTMVELQVEAVSRWLPDTTLTFVNEGCCRTLGRTREELIGTKWLTLVPEETRHEVERGCRKLVASPQVQTFEHQVVAAGGAIRWMRWNNSPVFDAQGRLAEIQAVGVDVTERRLADEALRKSRMELQRLSSQLLSAQESERHRIAQELHDEVGQSLTAALIDLTVVQKEMRSGLALNATERLGEACSLITTLSDRIRALSLDLRPSMLDDLGLASALRWYVKKYAQRVNVKAGFEVVGVKRRVPAELGIALYRVAQEALTNVAKHARAERVHVRLQQSASTIALSVKDDGVGFDVENVLGPGAKGNGAGLLGMRERIVLVGGTFSVQTRPDKGTTVNVEVPLRSKRRARGPSGPASRARR